MCISLSLNIYIYIYIYHITLCYIILVSLRVCGSGGRCAVSSHAADVRAKILDFSGQHITHQKSQNENPLENAFEHPLDNSSKNPLDK